MVKSSTPLTINITRGLSGTFASTYNRITITGHKNLLVRYGIILENYSDATLPSSQKHPSNTDAGIAAGALLEPHEKRFVFYPC